MKLATVRESDDALFGSQVSVNLKGSFNTMREAAKRLRAGGRIINLSSRAWWASISPAMRPTLQPRLASRK